MKLKAASLMLGAALAAAMPVPAIGAGTEGRWLHVRVLDRSERVEKVRINLPLTMLETMASSMQAEHVKNGRVQMGDSGLTPDQLRAMWQSLRSSGDMEFVTIESDDETVRVARSGNYMLAKIEGSRDGDGSRGKVDVKVPLKVVDALLDAPEGELNFKGALQMLADYDDGDLVTIHDGTSDVRVWIDDRSDSQN
jgi:transcriptional regulator of met regulon